MADTESTAVQPGQQPSARSRALILLSFVVVFGVASIMPAFYLDHEPYVWRGVHLLVLGVMGLKMGQYGWLANPLVLVALIGVMKGWRRVVPVLSVGAMLTGLHTLTVFGRDLQVGAHTYNVLHVIALGPGFYVWLAALLHPFVVFMLLRRKRMAQGFAC